MSEELKKRLKSLAWRAGMMAVAVLIDGLISNLGLFEIEPQYTVILGLILGEISKAVKNCQK